MASGRALGDAVPPPPVGEPVGEVVAVGLLEWQCPSGKQVGNVDVGVVDGGAEERVGCVVGGALVVGADECVLKVVGGGGGGGGGGT
jgi:hypothetical protein